MDNNPAWDERLCMALGETCRPGGEARGLRESGRQDLNLRPLGPQPVDAGVIYVQARPQASPRPRQRAHWSDRTVRLVPRAVPTGSPT